jgi:hypothetical protein
MGHNLKSAPTTSPPALGERGNQFNYDPAENDGAPAWPLVDAAGRVATAPRELIPGVDGCSSHGAIPSDKAYIGVETSSSSYVPTNGSVDMHNHDFIVFHPQKISGAVLGNLVFYIEWSMDEANWYRDPYSTYTGTPDAVDAHDFRVISTSLNVAAGYIDVSLHAQRRGRYARIKCKSSSGNAMEVHFHYQLL